MALAQCKECGNRINSQAVACPHCGKPQKHSGCLSGLGCGLLILLFIIPGALLNQPSRPTSTSAPTPQATVSPAPDATREVPKPKESATIPSSNIAQVAPTPISETPSVPQETLDPALVARGKALYEKLKHDYPDVPMLPDHDLPPHTIDISMLRTLSSHPYLDLSMPLPVWNKLGAGDKDALVAFIHSQIDTARAHPEKYADLDPRAPAYAIEVQSIPTVKDAAWAIHVGHLDNEGYLNEDKVVLQGADYDPSGPNDLTLIYANAKNDAVYNSLWDGSVSQVEDYHKKHLNDPDSVQYSDWTKVIKTGVGYQVSVTFRAKNEFGGYVIHDQTFAFDKQGSVTRVTDNNQ